MRAEHASLRARFESELLASGTLCPGDCLLVAVSGGLDSVVLLHLLRFATSLPAVELRAAHFDHAMRPSSGGDAHWVSGLCRGWRVPLLSERADAAPTSEESARSARYAFLEQARVAVGGRFVLTAHHADDQAETVLFRLLRGTGQAGLGGIPVRREPAIWRPLLGFWRTELESYAAEQRISWRDDPTNEHVRYARNALRRRVLPEIERLVAPRARRALVRLADLAREDESGWQSVLPVLMEPLNVTMEAGHISFRRKALLELHPAVRARIVRALAARLGMSLDEATTRLAIDFAASASSGRRLELGGSWLLRRELDRLVLEAGRRTPADRPLRIPDVGPGSGSAWLAGERIPVAWGGDETHPRRFAETFEPELLRFPLTVRARRPGDRIRLPQGTKKVKKLLLEMRLPTRLRERVPLVVDSGGHVLWIPQLSRRAGPPTGSVRDGFRIGIG